MRSLGDPLRSGRLGLPHDEKILESPKVEPEAPGAMLPHWVRGPVVVASNADDVHGLEEPREHHKRQEPERGKAAVAVCGARHPTEHMTGLQSQAAFPRDLFHRLEELPPGARDPPETRGVLAGPALFRVRRV